MGKTKILEYSKEDIVLSLMLSAHEVVSRFPGEKWGEFNLVDNELIGLIIKELNSLCFYDEISGDTFRFIFKDSKFSSDSSYYINVTYPDGTSAPANKINEIKEDEEDNQYTRYQKEFGSKKDTFFSKSLEKEKYARKIDVYTFKLNEGLALGKPINDSYKAPDLASVLRLKINQVVYRAIRQNILSPDKFFVLENEKQKIYNGGLADKDSLRFFYSDYEISFLTKANKYPERFKTKLSGDLQNKI